MVRMAFRVLALVTAVAVAGVAGEWSQWRGPGRNGQTPGGPSLATSWPKAGPPVVWQSETLPAHSAGGFGCVSVTGTTGKLCVYINWKYQEPITTRTLSDGEFRGRLGGFTATMPADVTTKLEEARQSEERVALKGGKPLDEWVAAWVKANVPAADLKKLGPIVGDRLKRGKGALPLPLLAKLETVKDKPFPTPEDLEKWLADNQIEGELKKVILAAIPTTVKKAHDVIVALDAATGQKLWEKKYPGLPHDWPASCTPAIADGKVYVLGSDGDLYCLSLDKGEEVWKAKPGKGCVNSSPLVHDGMVIVAAGAITALDAATGQVKWTQPKVKTIENSPVLWKAGDKTYLVCNTGGTVACLDAKDGQVAWTAPGGGRSTAVIDGEWMAINSGKKETGLIVYKITTQKAEKATTAPFEDQDSSPVIHQGHVYGIGQQMVCANLESGKTVWFDPKGTGSSSSAVMVNGKLLAVGKNTITLINPTPEKLDVLTKANVGAIEFTSPAIVDGRLYLRTAKGVTCFDLTAAAAATQEAK